jgi:hypothetical protein
LTSFVLEILVFLWFGEVLYTTACKHTAKSIFSIPWPQKCATVPILPIIPILRKFLGQE